jgi:tetratricopeptide (TPR) repeat protein
MKASASRQECVDQFNDLMVHMARTKEQLDRQQEEDCMDDGDDAKQQLRRTDRFLSEAIDFAIEQGRGWGPGEKEEYLKMIGDDDFIPPLFAGSVEEVQKSGLQDAFTSLIYENETPTTLCLRFKEKGNEAYNNGRRNQANNLQYYRDAINHYLESYAWAQKIDPLMPGDLAQADTDGPTYTPDELNQLRSNLCSNVALMHLQLRNWGMARDQSRQALEWNGRNVKAWYRLAKAHQMLGGWEAAASAVESGLVVDSDNVDLKKLSHQIDGRVRRSRAVRQQRERARAERASRVKAVWLHCKQSRPRPIRLGRVALASRVREDDEEGAGGASDDEGRWHHHLPHSGLLPRCSSSSPPQPSPDSDWSWPVLFLYPSHHQSDLIEQFGENEIFAVHLARLFPELDEDECPESLVPWDRDNEFHCSRLALYFEVHLPDNEDSSDSNRLVHPDSVEPIRDLASCLKYHEATRALKGDEGQDVADVVRALERKRLALQRKAWKDRHGSLWAKPDPCPVVRIHPAMSLKDALTDARMIVPNVRTLTHGLLARPTKAKAQSHPFFLVESSFLPRSLFSPRTIQLTTCF